MLMNGYFKREARSVWMRHSVCKMWTARRRPAAQDILNIAASFTEGRLLFED
jgi:hypothetical protein